MTSGNFRTIHQLGESYKCYIPDKLTSYFIDPRKYQELLDHANQALGRIDALSEFIPDINLFIYLYVRKEALLSSQIEGTQSSLTDLFMFENNITPSVELTDVEEVTNYVNAINYGLKRLQKDEFPFSLRLIKEIHKVLMKGVRGQEKNPGEFRTSQNWIGGTRPGNALYVPPPPELVIPLMGDLEKFIHSKDKTIPALIKIALAHVQFESIHPFLDGNGRIGRLLVTLLLCDWNILKNPILYISYFLKTNRQTYYDLLQNVRWNNDWDSWIIFFLKGIIESCQDEILATKRVLLALQEDLENIESIGRGGTSVKHVFEYLKKHPVTNIPEISEKLKISQHTALSALSKLEEMRIVKEITGKQRGKIYTYYKYINILSEGAQPL
jgi:Fic family protein